MSLPFSTTTITVRRMASLTGDPTEGASATTVESAVPAVISRPTGAWLEGLERVDAVLNADPCDLAAQDLVDDDETGDNWRVVWTRSRVALGLDHVTAGLVQVGGPDA